MQLKRCSKCGEKKDINEFYKRKKSKDGLMSCCKSCSLNNTKKYYLRNKTEVLKKRKIYQQTNKIIISKQKKLYEINNRGKRREREKNCAKENKDRYMKKLLRRQGFNKEEITEEIITLKRGIIKNKRVIKQIKTKQNE